MLKEISAEICDESIRFLDYLYQKESGEIFLKLLKGSRSKDVITSIDLEQYSLKEAPVSAGTLKKLKDEEVIDFREDAGDGSYIGCWITPLGMTHLQMRKEMELLKGQEISINRDTVRIQSGNSSDQQDVNLQYENPEDFWSSYQLTIKGVLLEGLSTIDVLAKVGVHVLDADTAYFQNEMKLGELFSANQFGTFHQDILDNHYVDGEPAHNMSEIADMLGLVDAANRKMLLIDRLLLNPLLVGRGIGKEILRRILLAYGQGGGIVVIPLIPTAAPIGSREFVAACERLKQHYHSLGFEEHPFVDNVMVGDIDICGMMMSADAIR